MRANHFRKSFISFRRMRVAVVAATATVAVGCSSVQYLPDGPLGHNERLRVVQRGVTSTSSGFRLLGILPLAFPSEARAERKILSEIDPVLRDAEHILVNRRIENRTVYFFLASVHTLTLHADLAEVERLPSPYEGGAGRGGFR
jgi:hypothetical protein